MALIISKAMARSMAFGPGMVASLASGTMNLFNGTVPATAGEAQANTNLLSITGISLDATTLISGNVVQKDGSTWSATSGTGTPTFFRHGKTGDAGTAVDPDDQTYPRLQGEVGAGKDMVLTNPSFSGGTEEIDFYYVTIPLKVA